MTTPDANEPDAKELVGLFEGLRVFEVGQFVAAPIAAQMFAHGGADVIKLEPVTGDLTRNIDPLDHPDGGVGEGRQYVVKAFGKRAIPVDLSTEKGRTVAHDLAASCDVVISNLRPGTAARLGLDYDSLRVRNANVVYGEINGYGDDGPLAQKPSLDLIAQSWTGVRLSASAVNDGTLAHYEAYFCDYTAGLLLAFGIASALRQREITGVGQRVSTSLAHAGVFVQHRSASLFEATDGWKRDLVARRGAGEPLADILASRTERTSPSVFFFSSYETADGMVSVGATGAMGQKFCRLFSIDDPRTTDAWRDRDGRPELIAQTKTALASEIIKLSSAELIASLEDIGIPCAPVRMLEELLVDPDALAAGILVEGEHPRLGAYTVPAPPVSFGGADYRVRPTIAAHGEHTDELLAELGYDAATINQLVADGIIARTGEADGKMA